MTAGTSAAPRNWGGATALRVAPGTGISPIDITPIRITLPPAVHDSPSKAASAGALSDLADGADGSMERCIEQFGGLVWSIAQRYVKDRASAEDVVQEVFTALEEELGVSPETLALLEEKAQQAMEQLQQVQGQAGDWHEGLLAELQGRAEGYLNMQPDEVAGTRREALLQARDYTDFVRDSLGDGRISVDEMNGIAQLGANASNSLNSLGGEELQGFSDRITNTTGQIARGELPQARDSLGGLDVDLPKRR